MVRYTAYTLAALCMIALMPACFYAADSSQVWPLVAVIAVACAALVLAFFAD